MQFRILGPLEVRSDHGAAVALGGRKPRAVLAVLLLRANEPVSGERLARALWGDDAPPGAVRTVQVHVSRLRKALGEDDIVATTPAGYVLHVQPGELDADRFEQLVEDGRAALAANRPEDAAALLREADELWHGPALADLAYEPFARTEIDQLEEQRLAALELRVEADAAAGRHAELVPELRHLVVEHPARERLAEQLMLALYRCGRQTEALEAYRTARSKLAEEIGVEPGPELRAMHQAVLEHDPALALAAPADLPDELEAAAAEPLVARDAEVEWLHQRWEEARAGAARLVVVAGPHGMGKTRLAAEVASEAHRTGAAVVYAACERPARACLDSLAAARSGPRPLLVVADGVDRAGADVVAAVRALRGPRVLVVMTATEPAALTELETDGVLFLKRLGHAGIGAIAALYAPDQAGAEVPIEELSNESGGVPARVHDAASRWARREARERVSAIAGRAVEGREELRSIEDELAGEVVQLQAVRDWDWPGDGDDDGDRVVCPFKGLASFEASDAPYFFGRERLVAELVARLVGAPLLAVVGPSGSGKSSVVRAGLLAALANGVLPRSDEWPQVVLRPGEHPLRELRNAIDSVTAERFVLAVDQFEETFTACADEAERSRFIAEVVRASTSAVVVLAIRADFYGRCAEYPALARLLAANHVLVGAMRRDELRRAVVLPAHRVGLRVEPDLVDALLHDVEDRPGALPLLSTALLELWQRRDGRRLRLSAYEATGGVRGAVARLAEDAFARLDGGEQALARRVLLRLATVEPEGGVERRRLAIADLDDGNGEVASVIDRLADGRLLTVSDGTVEFAHEALLREWPRLRDWIEEDRDNLRVHRSLTIRAQEWLSLGRDDGTLYRGAQLAETEAWAERADPPPSEAEHEFLTASLDRERRDRRARRRTLAIAFGALAVGIVVIGIVALAAIGERRDAEHQRNNAISRELAAESGKALAVDPELGLRLALWAYDTSPTGQAVTALREATLAFRQLDELRADSLDAWAAAYSPDGTRVVTGGTDGRAIVWDAQTGRELQSLEAGHGSVSAARYAPVGERIALGFGDGTVLVTDGSLASSQPVLAVKGQEIYDLAFSGDGERIAAAVNDGTVRVFAADGSGAVQLSGSGKAQFGVDIDSDGSRVVAAGEDGKVRLWNVDDGGPGRILHTGHEPQNDVAFSPDGTRILSVGDDGWIRLWEGARATRIRGEGRQLNAVAFSADGRRFAAGGDDGVTRVWSVAGGPPIAVLRGQRSRVFDIGFGRTSDRVVTAGDDGTARLWNAGQTQAWRVPSKTSGFDFNRDGRLLATSSADGTVRAWDTATGRVDAEKDGPDGYVAAKFSPASDTLVIPTWDAKLIRTWRVGAGPARVVVTLPDSDGIESARFDPTGERIVYVVTDEGIVVRDLGSGREIKLRGGPKTNYDALFSPDGKHVAALPESGAVPIWQVDRPEAPERTLKGHRGHVQSLDFSPDGRIATAGADRTVRVWGRSGRAVIMRGHEDEVTTVVFTADGSKVLSSSDDGTLRLWDSRTGDQLAVLQSGEGTLNDVALSADGKIATLAEGDVVRVFKCEVCGSVDEVRALALSRSPDPLTADERREYLAAAG